MRTLHSLLALLSSLLLAALLLAGCGGGGGGGSSAQPPTSLIYSAPNAVYSACAAITANVPSHGGGAPQAYAVSPALPTGLSLDAASGRITGTPTVVTPATTYTITASNSQGETSADVVIEVVLVAPAGLDYPGLPDELGQGVRADFDPQFAAGTGNSWSVTSGALPPGVALDPLTGTLSGVPTTLGSASFEITSTDCAGQTAVRNLSVDVVRPYARGVVVADAGGGTLSAFARDEGDGELQPNGWEWNATGTARLVVHPWGTFAYAASANTVRVHEVATGSGELRSAGASVTTQGAIAGLACSPNGQFLYATTATGRLYSWAIDGSSGGLTPTATPYALTGTDPRALAITPDSAYLYVALAGIDAIAAFELDAPTGQPTLISNYGSGDGVRALALSADGAWLYAASASTNSLHGYQCSALDGSLTPLGWSPKSVGGVDHAALALTPDADYLYLGSSSTAPIAMFSIHAVTGEPTALVPATATGLAPVARLAVEPRGGQLYAALTDGRVALYDINGSGQLEFENVGAYLAGEALSDLDFVRGHSEFERRTEHLYATSLIDDGVYEYAFDHSTGQLSDLPATPHSTGGTDPKTVSVHPFDEYLLVSHQNNVGAPAITVHALDASGVLQPGASAGSLRNNAGLALDSSGRFAFLASNPAGGARVVPYAFDAATGALDPGTGIAVTGTLWPPAVHPSGRLLVVPDSGGDELEVFSIAPQTGALTHTANVPTGGIDPFRAVFDASGRFVYTAHIGSASIAVHAVDLAASTLTPLAGSPVATSFEPLVMALSPDGRSLMIADTAAGQWEYFTIDQDPGSVALDGSLSLAGAGAQAGIAILRFDASSSYLFWVDSALGDVVCNPITAPGVLAAPTSSAPIGGSITSMEMRNRPR